jgi:hypothetical protein
LRPAEAHEAIRDLGTLDPGELDVSEPGGAATDDG